MSGVGEGIDGWEDYIGSQDVNERDLGLFVKELV